MGTPVKGELTDLYRGDILTPETSHNFVYRSGMSLNNLESARTLDIIFPERKDSPYCKKQLVEELDTMVYCITRDWTNRTDETIEFLSGSIAVSPYFNEPNIPSGAMDLLSTEWNQYFPIPFELHPNRLAVGVWYTVPPVVGRTYKNAASIQVYSHTGAFPPYFIRRWKDAVPWTENHTPAAGGIVEGSGPVTLGWEFKYHHRVQAALTQLSATLRVRRRGEVVYTQYVLGSEAGYTLPANTLDAAWIEWQVAVVSDDAIEGAFSDWMPLQVRNPRLAAKAESPNGILINAAAPRDFSWSLPYAQGSEQTGYELQQSRDAGGSWTALAAGDGGAQGCTVGADTFSEGTVWWRVRLRNGAQVWGDWSDPGVFVAQSRPQTPGITGIDAVPRAVIRWTARGQQAFQVQAGGLDSGPRYGRDTRSYRLEGYLPAGEYTARVRIQNMFGEWSGWGEKRMLIENRELPQVRLGGRAEQYAVTLRWDTGDGFIKFYIFRDGKMVGKTEGRAYTDAFAHTRHVYQVRGVTADGYYRDSNTLLEYPVFTGAVIAQAGVFDWLALEYRYGGRPVLSESRTRLVDYKHLDGREKPCAEVSEFTECVHRFLFSFERREDYRKLLSLVGKTVIYKNEYGDRAIGILNDPAGNLDWKADCAFTVTETDYREEVEYD